MAFKIGSAFIQFTLKGTNKLLGSLKSIGRGFVSLGRTVAKIGLGIAAAFTGFAIVAIKQAADAEEALDAFSKVFGELEPRATKFADTLAAAIGRSKIEIKEGLTDFQAFAKGLGLADEEAFKFSKSAQQLSLDLASFRNLQDTEAQQRFIAALSGSGETLIRFGINVKEAAVNEFLLAQGFAKGSAGANEQQKAVARLQVIMRDMGRQDGAIGNAAETAGSFTNELKGLTGEVKDVTIEIGTKLIPMAKRLVVALRENLPAIQNIAISIAEFIASTVESFDKLRVGIVNFTLTTTISFLSWVKSIVDGFDTILGFLRRVKDIFLQVGAVIGESMIDLANVIATAFRAAFDNLLDPESALEQIDKAFDVAMRNTKQNIKRLGKLFQEPLEVDASAASRSLRDTIRKLRNQLTSERKKDDAATKAGRPSIAPPELPKIPPGGKVKAPKIAKGFESVEALFKRVQTQISGESIEQRVLAENKKQTKVAVETKDILKGMAADIGKSVQTQIPAVLGP